MTVVLHFSGNPTQVQLVLHFTYWIHPLPGIPRLASRAETIYFPIRIGCAENSCSSSRIKRTIWWDDSPKALAATGDLIHAIARSLQISTRTERVSANMSDLDLGMNNLFTAKKREQRKYQRGHTEEDEYVLKKDFVGLFR